MYLSVCYEVSSWHACELMVYQCCITSNTNTSLLTQNIATRHQHCV